MKISPARLVMIWILLLSISFTSYAQDTLLNKLDYEIFRVLPFIVINKDDIKNVTTLKDINPRYEEDWVKEYESVEIRAFNKGKLEVSKSKNDTLNSEQKNIIIDSDPGSNISVTVKYIPDNSLALNEIKENSFSFSLSPEHDAQFAGGDQPLEEYLKEQINAEIRKDHFKQYQLASIKFQIDPDGYVKDPHVFWSSDSDKLDNKLLDIVCKMPKWKPASYSNGFKVNQDFAFTIGDHKSCVMNMLKLPEPEESMKEK